MPQLAKPASTSCRDSASFFRLRARDLDRLDSGFSDVSRLAGRLFMSQNIRKSSAKPRRPKLQPLRPAEAARRARVSSFYGGEGHAVPVTAADAL